MREAVRRARARGVNVSAVTLHCLWPVPEALLARAMEGTERIVVAELNLGQYRREIERIAAGRTGPRAAMPASPCWCSTTSTSA